SWGTAFKAPEILDLYDTSQNGAGVALFPDPQSPSGRSVGIVRQGNNPNLKEETATTWSAGLDLVPISLPGFPMSMTYYDVRYEDRVIRPGPASPFDILFQENMWAAVITRSPQQSEIDAICNSPEFLCPPSQCRT